MFSRGGSLLLSIYVLTRAILMPSLIHKAAVEPRNICNNQRRVAHPGWNVVAQLCWSSHGGRGRKQGRGPSVDGNGVADIANSVWFCEMLSGTWLHQQQFGWLVGWCCFQQQALLRPSFGPCGTLAVRTAAHPAKPPLFPLLLFPRPSQGDTARHVSR